MHWIAAAGEQIGTQHQAQRSARSTRTWHINNVREARQPPALQALQLGTRVVPQQR